MKEVVDFLKNNRVFYLATCEGDQPRVRPFGALACFEEKLYIVTNNQKKVYQQMISNNNVEICSLGADNTWLRIEAKVIHDSRKEALEQMLKENPVLTSMYSVDDNLMEVFYLKDVTATFYSYTSEPRVINF